jgi:hypothetical protein
MGHGRNREILMVADVERSEGHGLLMQSVPSVNVASTRDHKCDGDCARTGMKKEREKGALHTSKKNAGSGWGGRTSIHYKYN